MFVGLNHTFPFLSLLALIIMGQVASAQDELIKSLNKRNVDVSVSSGAVPDTVSVLVTRKCKSSKEDWQLIAKFLKNHPDKKIYLNIYSIRPDDGGESMKALQVVAQQIDSLIVNSSNFDNDSLEPIASFTQIRSIFVLPIVESISDETFARILSKLNKLEALRTPKSCGRKTIEQIAKIKTLKWLYIECEKFDEDWMNFLAGHRKLEYIFVSCAAELDQYKLYAPLFKNPSLKRIALKKVDDRIVSVLEKFMTFEELLLSGGELTKKGIESIQHLEKLKKLTITNTSLSNATFQSLKNLKNLEFIELDKCPGATREYVDELRGIFREKIEKGDLEIRWIPIKK